MRIPSYKRIAFAAAMLLPLTAGAIGIPVIINGQTIIFTDVPQSAWFATHVQSATEAGIVNGYKDAQGRLTGRFGPENHVTLGEVFKIASESAGYNEEDYGNVIASGTKHWSSVYVSVAIGENFPVTDALRQLDRDATRAEVAAIIAAAFRVTVNANPSGTTFKDVQMKTAFGAAIEALALKAVVSGDTDSKGAQLGTYRPIEAINRAEVVKIAMSARAAYGEPGEGRKPTAEQTTISLYREEGFSPQVLRVKIGTTVTFRNDSARDLWIASNPHPIHTGYPEFDSGKAIRSGAEYTFTFSKIGTWGFHNHLHSVDTATVIVE